MQVLTAQERKFRVRSFILGAALLGGGEGVVGECPLVWFGFGECVRWCVYVSVVVANFKGRAG